MDFSKYSTNNLPKLAPLPDSANVVHPDSDNVVHKSSLQSCGSSYTSLFTTDTATVSERGTTQPHSDSDGEGPLAVTIDLVDDEEETSSSSSGDDERHEKVCVCVYVCMRLRVFFHMTLYSHLTGDPLSGHDIKQSCGLNMFTFYLAGSLTVAES